MFVALLVLLLLVTMILVGVSVRAARPTASATDGGWGTGTRFFLVLLRLAIGWHFLIEGLDKIQNETWSSEAYLRESVGPLAPAFRNLAGDRLVDKLSVGEDRSFPAALAVDWDVYFQRYKEHYSLDDKQIELAEIAFKQQKQKAVEYLAKTKRPIAMPSPQPPSVPVEMTVPERIAELKKREERVRQIEEQELPAASEREQAETFAKLRAAKGSAAAARASLRADLAAVNQALAGALTHGAVLTSEQVTLDPIQPSYFVPGLDNIGDWSLLDWSDFLVKWGLVVVGGLLLLGLLTRTACVAGALYLLLFFLAMPPLPGYPESPRAEGHYLFINKNIIEMLALLALATTRSGRWAGLDGLLALVRKPSEDTTVVRTTYLTETETVSPKTAPPNGGAGEKITSAPSQSKEKPHGP
jgi:uncharacterized membrane protein YphA (DoxX/SURF4 family)